MKHQTVPRLSSNALKLIALAAMTADHIGAYLLPNISALRVIGRIAFPIFAYMIAEGCRHTSNRPRYFFTVFLLGAATQAFLWHTRRAVYQNILITFSISIALIFLVEAAWKKRGIRAGILALLGGALILLYPCGFAIDYGLCGALLAPLIYLGQTPGQRLALAAVGLTGVNLTLGSLQWFSLLAIPLLALYSGERGQYRLKYLFYIYYPLHLVAIEAIRCLWR